MERALCAASGVTIGEQSAEPYRVLGGTRG
jgi:hypothetical protein